MKTQSGNPKRAQLIVIATIMALVCAGRASSIAPPYEVATWHGFRPGAVSFTFDDSCSNQFALALPMFNEKGLKVTLFSCTEVMFAGWPQLRRAAAQGHEIGSHTVTHSNFSTLSDAQQLAELTNSLIAINSNVTNQKCVTLAYPFCVEGQDSLVAQYYIGARGCSGQISPKTPGNFMNISSYVCGPEGSIQTLENFTNAANNAAVSSGWCVYLIHGIEQDGGYSPLPSATLQQCVDFFGANQDRFWVQTFGNVVRYVKERNAVVVTDFSTSSNAFVLSVTDNLDDAVYNFPVTLRRPLPADWSGAVVSQNGAPVKSTIARENSTNYIIFDVVPNDWGVTITKAAAPAPGARP